MNTATALKTNTADTVKMTIRQWATEDRPSEKLQMYGVQALSDAELLSIVIGSGTNRYTAVDIAQNILDKFDRNLNSLGKARFDEIKDVEGVGTYTSCRIMAAVELGRRRQMATAEVRPDMSTATRIYNYLLPRMMDLETKDRTLSHLRKSGHGFSNFSPTVVVICLLLRLTPAARPSSPALRASRRHCLHLYFCDGSVQSESQSSASPDCNTARHRKSNPPAATPARRSDK